MPFYYFYDMSLIWKTESKYHVFSKNIRLIKHIGWEGIRRYKERKIAYIQHTETTFVHKDINSIALKVFEGILCVLMSVKLGGG